MGSNTSKSDQKKTPLSFENERKIYFGPTYEIYPQIKYSKDRVKKLIINQSIAPMFPPEDEQNIRHSVECSICNYFFPITNISCCCRNTICTECFLQIAPNGEPNKINLINCPWCRKERFKIKYDPNLLPYYQKIYKRRNGEEKRKMYILEKKAKKNELFEFEKERNRIKNKLLKIKEKEEKEGSYRIFELQEQEKKQKRELNKKLFLEQKNNQEKIDQENIQMINQSTQFSVRQQNEILNNLFFTPQSMKFHYTNNDFFINMLTHLPPQQNQENVN
ncbi:protein sip5 [Anaeramoeba flamelloides]|uniref:Protein sip5 n=1 Tax=Anaeramoeba flamelloides TaxID=1746091 RepID=A0AAV7Z3X7_9EUKA|nr:protein sip5 [Anaeramoeba flamelloides]